VVIIKSKLDYYQKLNELFKNIFPSTSKFIWSAELKRQNIMVETVKDQ